MMKRLLAAMALCIAVGCTPPPTNPPSPAAAPEAAPADDATTAPAPPDTETPAETTDTANLPAAESVLAASVEASGGREPLEKIQSYYLETRMEVPAASISGLTKLWWKKGDFYSETDLPGVGQVRMWQIKGETWSDDPVQGVRKLEGREAEQARWTNSLLLAADWKNFFETAETVGRREAGDATLLDVRLTSKDGEEVTLSFDETSKLLAETQFLQTGPTGQMPIRMRISEYKDYAGLKLAERIEMDMAIVKAQTTVISFKPGAKVDAKKLKPPKLKPPKK